MAKLQKQWRRTGNTSSMARCLETQRDVVQNYVLLKSLTCQSEKSERLRVRILRYVTTSTRGREALKDE